MKKTKLFLLPVLLLGLAACNNSPKDERNMCYVRITKYIPYLA